MRIESIGGERAKLLHMLQSRGIDEGTQRRGGGYVCDIGQLRGVWMFILEQGIGTWEGDNKEVSRDVARFSYLLTSPPPAGTMIRVTS